MYEKDSCSLGNIIALKVVSEHLVAPQGKHIAVGLLTSGA